MKHLIAICGFALAIAAASSASAQSSPPALPALTAQQTQEVASRMDAYRRATDARVARNEITADEGARLVQWREWQIAQQVAATQPAPPDRAPPDYGGVPPDYPDSTPPDYRESAPPDYRAAVPPDYTVEPAPPYAPYYRPAVPYYPYPHPYPYYYGRPYAYWGPSVCAGGFGRHFGGRICF